MRKIEFSEEQEKEIIKEYKKCKNVKKLRQLQALYLRIKGKTTEEIAEITEYNKSYVLKITKKYMNKGISSIIENHYKGNNRKLSVEEEKEFLTPFIEDANKGKMLTVKEIRIAYDKVVPLSRQNFKIL